MGRAHADVEQRMLVPFCMRIVFLPSKLALQGITKAEVLIDTHDDSLRDLCSKCWRLWTQLSWELIFVRPSDAAFHDML